MHAVNADGRTCPVCDSRYLLYVRDLPSVMIPGTGVPLFFCMECQSFCCTPTYREDDAENQRSVGMHAEWAPMNRRRYEALWPSLNPKRGILEIGCGIGTLLKLAKDKGVPAVGFDTNEHAARYGRDVYGVDVRPTEWNSDVALDFAPDVICCIQTMEHLYRPRELFAEFAKAAKRWNASIYVNVPMVNTSVWPEIFAPNPANPYFYLCDYHVTFATWEGLQTWAKIAPGLTAEYLDTPELAGVLYRFG